MEESCEDLEYGHSAECFNCLLHDLPDDPHGYFDQKSRPLHTWQVCEKVECIQSILMLHEGEIRELDGRWVLIQAPFPDPRGRDAPQHVLKWFNGQFCLTVEEQRAREEYVGHGQFEGGGAEEAGHWRLKLQNTFLMPTVDNSDRCHWRRQAHCVTLAQLFVMFGNAHTAADLYKLYLSLPVLGKSSHNRLALRATAPLETEMIGLWWKEDEVTCAQAYVALDERVQIPNVFWNPLPVPTKLLASGSDATCSQANEDRILQQLLALDHSSC